MLRRVLLLLFGFPVLVWAQSYTASVRGIVTDQTQAAVPAAQVTLTDVNRNQAYTTMADSEGRWVLAALPPGTYVLAVEAAGFRKHTQPAFRLEVQQQATINAQLSLGEVTETVQVQASAPMLNTTIATLGQVVENKFILSMPLAGRNPMALVMLAPGLVPSNISAGGVANVNFVANGTRNSTADAMLDGTVITGVEQNGGVTDVKYSPSVDVIEEFKIQTNFFSAEFGNTGGAVINMVSKSGTNDLHGVLYEFHRNAALNANSFFSNRQGRSIPDFKRNVFGGTVGGPLLIPKLYNGKSRTFFFFDYEGSRQESATTTTRTVPTERQLQGDFSDTRLSNGQLAVIYNPFDTYTASDGRILRRPFAGNAIPLSMQSPIARQLLSYYTPPNSEGAPFTRVNNYFNQGVNDSVGDKLDAKIDHNLSSKQRFTVRYSLSWGSNLPANLTGNIADGSIPGTSRIQNFVYDHTYTQSPTTILSGRLGVLRVKSDRDPVSTGFDPTSLGLPAVYSASGIKHFPNIAPAGYSSLGAGGFAIIHRGEDVIALNGSMTKIIRAHSVKTGIEARFFRENYFQPGYPAGSFNFARAQTGENPLVASSVQGDAIASMLLGWGSGGTYDLDQATATASRYWAFYAQDDWKVTRRLTLNFGLRYDFDVPRTERFDRLNWYDFEVSSPIRGKVAEFPDLKGVMRFVDDQKRSPFDGDYNNIQPRFGFAYALGEKTSIRAGYGIFYSLGRHTIKGEVGSAFRAGSGIQWSRDAGYTRYATMENPYPDGLTLPPGRDPLAYLGLGFSAYDPKSQNPEYQQWNLSLQREVPGNGVVEVNYAGSKGTHLYFGSGDVLGNRNKLDPNYYALGRTELNRQVPNPFLGVITDPRSILSLPTVPYNRLLRPYPHHAGGMGGYLAPPNIANSIYHSAQFKYEKRFSRGLAVLGHYTISKLISDSDVSSSDVDWLGGGTGVQNWRNLRLERSLSVFDIPQRAVVSFNYQLPFGRGRAIGGSMNRLADALVGGWEFSSILTFSSGYPLSVGLDSGTLWEGSQRPNLIGDPRTFGAPSTRLDQYFNVNAFSRPAPDTYGTGPRTLPNYRWFGIQNGDVTVMKNVAVTESKRVELRVEAFNLTNTPTFGTPNTSFGSSSFGIISGYASGRGPRELQLGVKFYY
jgi:Carboxypeptidase regulatory-like domain